MVQSDVGNPVSQHLEYRAQFGAPHYREVWRCMSEDSGKGLETRLGAVAEGAGAASSGEEEAERRPRGSLQLLRGGCGLAVPVSSLRWQGDGLKHCNGQPGALVGSLSWEVFRSRVDAVAGLDVEGFF